MLPYVMACWEKSGKTLPVSLQLITGGGGSGKIADIDEYGIIFVETNKKTSAIPWSAIVMLTLDQ